MAGCAAPPQSPSSWTPPLSPHIPLLLPLKHPMHTPASGPPCQLGPCSKQCPPSSDDIGTASLLGQAPLFKSAVFRHPGPDSLYPAPFSCCFLCLWHCLKTDRMPYRILHMVCSQLLGRKPQEDRDSVLPLMHPRCLGQCVIES